MKRLVNRRTFLKTVGAVSVATVVAGGLEGCNAGQLAAATPVATAAPVATVAPTTAAVATVAPTTAATTAATVAATTAATTAVMPTAPATAGPTAAATSTPAVAPAAGDTYTFFNSVESAFVEAASARIIPNDDLGPGALEAGAPYYVDHQLAGAYGVYSRRYTMGPWTSQALPEQGYQMRLNAREIYRASIREVNAYCTETFQKTFDQLEDAQKDEVLTGMQGGDIKLATIPAGTFFGILRADIVQGFFCDPLYGGNRDMVGWRLVGYPGIPTPDYATEIDQIDKPYTRELISIASAVGSTHS